MIRFFFLSIFLFISQLAVSQDIDALMDNEMEQETNYIAATFKSTRIINAHSVEQMKAKHLDFRISHRFGALNTGGYNFFGLDQSTIHLSLEYGLFDWLMVGIGRSNFQKTYDGFLKFKILRQSTGNKKMPITLSYLVSTELNTIDWSETDRENFFESRFAFVHQLLIARKFNRNFSLQLMPTVIHRNLVATALQFNDLPAMGIGLRYKLSNRIALTAEYFYGLHSFRTDAKHFDTIAVGIDIETGGHVFQIMLSNARAMRENGFIWGDSNGDFFNGDIHLGFNISRVFSFKKNKIPN